MKVESEKTPFYFKVKGVEENLYTSPFHHNKDMYTDLLPHTLSYHKRRL